MLQFDLSGEWKLYAVDPEKMEITQPSQLKGLKPITGSVPGNLELDLTRAGITKDPFIGENGKAYRKYEYFDFWYQREFTVPKNLTGACDLVFDAVDCFAEYFLNGEKIGTSANAFIPFRFPVTVKSKNILTVRIISAEIAARDFPEESASITHMAQVWGTLYARKPAHDTGWDISPRLQLGGIWKSVRLEKKESDFNFINVWMDTRLIDQEKKSAWVILNYHFEAGRHSLDGYMLKFTGRCGKSVFTQETPAWFTYGQLRFIIQDPELWYPVGYGSPNLYKLTAELYDPQGKKIADFTRDIGIRTVKLDMTETNADGKGRFDFYINGIRVRIHGSNHIPLDAMHSRDPQRMKKVLELFRKSNCNMLRCWGGGVYESDEFYDFCDRNGIMVWQDFMFGCAAYPQNKTFFDIVQPEIEYEVRRLRSHPSLVLWCGDNECDQLYCSYQIPLKWNHLNRELLPEIVHRLDPLRPYIPSSPYIAPEAEPHVYAGNITMQPERHLWGARETFKLPYYSQSQAKFISETGWHGCPNLSSLKKFLTPKHFKLDESDPEWDYHASNPFTWNGGPMKGRSLLNGKQLREYFHTYPKDLKEYARYTQIHQAEAFKFMVEGARLDPSCGGILWWNIIDCWPQFSDAVVDYYFGKKLAYHYLTRSQQPFCIMCREPAPWNSSVIAVNDTNETAAGTFEVETENGIELAGTFEIAPGGHKILGELRSPRATNALWLIRWQNNEKKGANHYISGNIQMDFAWYMKCLPAIATLDNSFDAEKFAL